METVLHNPIYAWLAFGAGLIVFEAFTVPGLGLFLAGLGALCTGLLVQSGFVDVARTDIQCAWFFGATVVWALVLWRPLQKFRMNKKQQARFNNIIGETAVVGESGLKRGQVGQVAWSGTLMRAELGSDSTFDAIPGGSQVIITAVSGTTLTVIPK